jgi:hypothetical protein
MSLRDRLEVQSALDLSVNKSNVQVSLFFPSTHTSTRGEKKNSQFPFYLITSLSILSSSSLDGNERLYLQR